MCILKAPQGNSEYQTGLKINLAETNSWDKYNRTRTQSSTPCLCHPAGLAVENSIPYNNNMKPTMTTWNKRQLTASPPPLASFSLAHLPFSAWKGAAGPPPPGEPPSLDKEGSTWDWSRQTLSTRQARHPELTAISPVASGGTTLNPNNPTARSLSQLLVLLGGTTVSRMTAWCLRSH